MIFISLAHAKSTLAKVAAVENHERIHEQKEKSQSLKKVHGRISFVDIAKTPSSKGVWLADILECDQRRRQYLNDKPDKVCYGCGQDVFALSSKHCTYSGQLCGTYSGQLCDRRTCDGKDEDGASKHFSIRFYSILNAALLVICVNICDRRTQSQKQQLHIVVGTTFEMISPFFLVQRVAVVLSCFNSRISTIFIRIRFRRTMKTLAYLFREAICDEEYQRHWAEVIISRTETKYVLHIQYQIHIRKLSMQFSSHITQTRQIILQGKSARIFGRFTKIAKRTGETRKHIR